MTGSALAAALRSCAAGLYPAAANSKLAQAGGVIARRNAAVCLGMPAYRDTAGRVTTGPARP